MTRSNEELDAGSRIQVVVRVRPVLPHEVSEPVAVSCSQDGRKVQVALPERETSKPALAASSRPDAKAYGFDACLTGSTTQAQLFNVCGIDELVEAAVDGYCCTVFAFGQTGSGKTYTIIGPSMAGLQEAAWSAPGSGRVTGVPQTPLTPATLAAPTEPSAVAEAPGAEGSVGEQQPAADNDCHSTAAEQQQGQPASSHSNFRIPTGAVSNSSSMKAAHRAVLGEDEGLLARCVDQLYTSIQDRQQEVACRVLASCCEIYNEAVTDLLAKNKSQQLQVRQDSFEAFYVDGLTQKEVADPHRALTLLADALNYRHTRAHQLNSYSSRSHCLITFTVASQELDRQQGARGGVRRVGKLVLVDLAGSERLKDTGSSAKEAVRETGAINKSLFMLGQVLAALSVRGGCGVTGHVPYRDSRLTQLLWDGLRGGGRALMLACLSPLKAHAEESLNTLHFASMALRIKSQPIIMLDPQDQMVLEMRETIKALQEDCRSLAGAIARMTSPGADVTAVLQALPPTLVQDALRCGSSSAPSAEQGSCPSPSRSLRGSGNRARTRTSSGDRAKPFGRPSKPKSADASIRRSLPALLSHPRSQGNPSKQNRDSSKSLLLQQPPMWNSSPALNSVHTRDNSYMFLGRVPADALLGSLTAGAAGGNNRSSRSSLPPYVTPPRSGGDSVSSIQRGSFDMAKGSLHNPGLGAYPGGSLLGRLGQPYASSNMSNSTSPWMGSSKYPSMAARGGAGSSSSSTTVPTGVLSSHLGQQNAPRGSILQLPRKSTEDFPELAAMEQQFQQHLRQESAAAAAAAAAGGAGGSVKMAHAGDTGAQQQPLPAVAATFGNNGVQEAVHFSGTGAPGMLLPSGLPASINEPRTLVPVRMSVTDTETVGTNPGASPVVVAIAAADTHVRPLAVPLRPSATAGTAGGSSVGDSASQYIGSVGPSGSTGAHGSVGGGAAGAGDVAPEPKALGWAERNSWFGSDAQMTQLAYQVHDHLVQQGMDPACDAYYAAIESRVAAAFPDKWAQHLAILAATGHRLRPARGTLQQCTPSGVYTSYKMSLKPSVATIRSSKAAGARASSTWQLQQQSPDPAAVTLSQLLQHPQLATSTQHHAQQLMQQQPQQHTGQQTAGGQLPGKAFAEEMLQLYQQHDKNAAAVAVSAGHEQQQQQQVAGSAVQSTLQMASAAAGLPALQMCASPVPQAGPESFLGPGPESPHVVAAAACGAVHSNLQCAAAGVAQCEPAGVPAAAATATRRSISPGSSGLQQPARLPGGVSLAAGRVLASNAATYYTGAGPLTTGAKQAWSMSKYGQQAESGKSLAEVLRSGAFPGNKSLSELQADYRAARALVLDQLRQQKEAAEQQRRQILMQIGRAINSSKWRA